MIIQGLICLWKYQVDLQEDTPKNGTEYLNKKHSIPFKGINTVVQFFIPLLKSFF